eukprot:3498264-Heterocapsa_arctica.AAC.1
MLSRLNICLKLRFCAKSYAFCEESSGDSEDARRPIDKTSKTFRYLQKPSKPYTPACVHL